MRRPICETELWRASRYYWRGREVDVPRSLLAGWEVSSTEWVRGMFCAMQ